MATGRRWTREELLLVLHLYERIPFGKQDQSNPLVIELAGVLSRTPGSVAMKLNNFTSLDPDEQARGIKGLTGRARLAASAVARRPRGADRGDRLSYDPPRAELLSARRAGELRSPLRADWSHAPGSATASHISPWAEDASNRPNATNGLCLNKLHDAAFDRKLITFDEDLRLVVSRRLRNAIGSGALAEAMLRYEGQPLTAPVRRPVSTTLLQRHRTAFLASDR